MDFDLLASNAYDRETGKPGSREDLDLLWRSVFQLEYWNFLIHPEKAMQPYIMTIEEQSWLLVFTDNSKLNAYARAHELLTPDGKAMSMSIPTPAARDWLNRGHGHVYGVRFNEGDFGWYAPIDALNKIYQHLFS